MVVVKDESVFQIIPGRTKNPRFRRLVDIDPRRKDF